MLIIGGILAYFATNATIQDVKTIRKMDDSDLTIDDDNVKINNSYRIKTPWAQYAYSFYLNHFNEKTRDIIKGNTYQVQFEWMCYNVLYHLGIKKEQTGSVDIGETIFADNHGILTGIMLTGYALTNPFFTKEADIYIIYLLSKFLIREKKE